MEEVEIRKKFRFHKFSRIWSVVRNKAKSYGVLYANYSYLNWTGGIQENGAEVVIDSWLIKN